MGGLSVPCLCCSVSVSVHVSLLTCAVLPAAEAVGHGSYVSLLTCLLNCTLLLQRKRAMVHTLTTTLSQRHPQWGRPRHPMSELLCLCLSPCQPVDLCRRTCCTGIGR